MIFVRLSLIVLVVIAAYVRRLPKAKALILLGMVLTSPLFVYQFTSQIYYFWWFVIFLLWSAVLFSKTKATTIFAKVAALLITAFLILHNNGLVDSRLNLDRERTFLINNKFEDKIVKFQQQATYMPYRLRFKVFGTWIVAVNVVGRTFRFLGPDVLMNIIGVGFVALLVIGAINKGIRWELLTLFVGGGAAALARDPNTLTYFWLWPALIIISSEGMKRVGTRLAIILFLLNFAYILVP